MRPPILLMFHDEVYNEIAHVSFPAAKAFAQTNGMEFIGVSRKTIPNPWMYKLGLIEHTLCSHADDLGYLIYADADVLFRNIDIQNLDFIGDRAFEVSSDKHGVCAGFMAMRALDSVVELLALWRRLGECSDEPYGPGQHDQATLKLLLQHFSWVQALVSVIPESLVSNPESFVRGTIAHHYWANRAEKHKVVECMEADYKS